MIRGRRLVYALLIAWAVAVVASQIVVSLEPSPRARVGARRIEVSKATMPIGSIGDPPTLEVFDYGPRDAEHTIVALHGSPTRGDDFRRFAAALGEDRPVGPPRCPTTCTSGRSSAKRSATARRSA